MTKINIIVNELKRCSACKCEMLLKYFTVNKKGVLYKTCDKCREKNVISYQRNKHNYTCIHNRRRTRCKDCHGSGICSHNKVRDRCKDCAGGSICDHNKQRAKCKECDINGYTSLICRGRIHSALKSKKSKHTIKHLGCNITEFKEHIEKSFKEGMTWSNHGEWHIDHITPLKYDNPTLEQTVDRLHWTNTQALWASENIAKGNRFIG